MGKSKTRINIVLFSLIRTFVVGKQLD